MSASPPSTAAKMQRPSFPIADELARPFASLRIMTAGAAAAGAAARRRRQKEEEEMTRYTPQELAEGWEFKFVRSATGAFKTTAFLRAVLDEEQRTGWTLVERFDNGRIRLKRPASARANESRRRILRARPRPDQACGLRP